MDEWNWPDSLDALVAAADFHTLLFANDDVRVLETRIGPGETTPVHTHRWPGVLYVVSGSEFVRRNGNGDVLVDSRADGSVLEPGAATWSPPLPPHTLENVGEREIRIVSVEMKLSK
jgi:mannose-6-phosphate isomerase-like protein (cupin superfamily)